MVNDIYQQGGEVGGPFTRSLPLLYAVLIDAHGFLTWYSTLCPYDTSASVILNQVYGTVVLMDSSHHLCKYNMILLKDYTSSTGFHYSRGVAGWKTIRRSLS